MHFEQIKHINNQTAKYNEFHLKKRKLLFQILTHGDHKLPVFYYIGQ